MLSIRKAYFSAFWPYWECLMLSLLFITYGIVSEIPRSFVLRWLPAVSKLFPVENETFKRLGMRSIHMPFFVLYIILQVLVNAWQKVMKQINYFMLTREVQFLVQVNFISLTDYPHSLTAECNSFPRLLLKQFSLGGLIGCLVCFNLLFVVIFGNWLVILIYCAL